MLALVAGLSVFLGIHSWLEVQERARRLRQMDRALGIVRPPSWIQQWRLRAQRPQKIRDLPDFLELLALALSSGLPFQSALSKAVGAMPASPLREELQQTLRDISRGQPRAACLEDLGRRLGDERCRRIFKFLVHSLKQGSALDGLLREQAAVFRTERFHALERRAQTAPLRLLLPIFLFLLPAVMMILLGPLVIQVVQRGSLF